MFLETPFHMQRCTPSPRKGVSGFGMSLQTKCCFSDHVNMGYTVLFHRLSLERCWPCRKWFLTPDIREYESNGGVFLEKRPLCWFREHLYSRLCHDMLFQRQPRGDYRVIEGNCSFNCIFSINVYSYYVQHSFMKYNEHLVHFRMFIFLFFCFVFTILLLLSIVWKDAFFINSPLGNMLTRTYCLVIIKIFHIYDIYLYIDIYMSYIYLQKNVVKINKHRTV